MKLLGILIAYVAVSAGLFGALSGGVFWLLQADPTAAREQRAAPIPPRIAESIERKSAPIAQVAVMEPAPVKPIMQEAPVALTQPPRRVQIRELASPSLPSSVKRKPRRGEQNIAAQPASPSQEASSANVRAAVSTARTDNPY
jgi:hypothetical protein